MATTKKTSTSRKSSKSKNVKSTARPWSWRFSVITIGIYTIAVTTLILGALFLANLVSTQQNKARLERIETVYNSLNLDDSYRTDAVSVFGDKRVYEWDKSRSYSSSVTYLHADTVSNTVADVDAKIKAAGFEFFDEPYPGSVATQYHYKSQNGTYVRLTVSSKPYDDAVSNAFIMDKDSTLNSLDSIDKNAGPSKVLIKVNLDDNNE